MISAKMLVRYFAAWLLAWPLVGSANCLDAKLSLEKLQSLVETRNTAQEALVMVRRSAQDFKNLLLRGSDPLQAKTLRERFESNAKRYEILLAFLHKQLSDDPAELVSAEGLLLERTVLFNSYRNALNAHDIQQSDGAREADKSVQGADVKTLRMLERIIEKLNVKSADAFQSLRAIIHRCSG